VIREGNHIPNDTYARLQHMQTGFWLHGLQLEYSRRGRTVVSPPTASTTLVARTKVGLQWLGWERTASWGVGSTTLLCALHNARVLPAAPVAGHCLGRRFPCAARALRGPPI
jgi:hypothetical protein